MGKSGINVLFGIAVLFARFGVLAASLPADATYRALPALPFDTVKSIVDPAKAAVTE